MDSQLKDSFFALKNRVCSPSRVDNSKNQNLETILTTDHLDSVNFDNKNIEFRLKVSLGEKSPYSGSENPLSEPLKVKNSVALLANSRKCSIGDLIKKSDFQAPSLKFAEEYPYANCFQPKSVAKSEKPKNASPSNELRTDQKLEFKPFVQERDKFGQLLKLNPGSLQILNHQKSLSDTLQSSQNSVSIDQIVNREVSKLLRKNKQIQLLQ